MTLAYDLILIVSVTSNSVSEAAFEFAFIYLPVDVFKNAKI